SNSVARKWAACVVCALAATLATSSPAGYASSAPLVGRALQARQSESQVSADVARLLGTIKAADSGHLAVSEEDGRFLRVLVATSNATRALEIGAADGYSAIWIGLALRQTGGHLT